jgi:hypothetical protein
MVPPRNVTLEIGKQLVRRGERVIGFLPGKMPVIALTGLIVVAKNALSGHHIRQPVLELM